MAAALGLGRGLLRSARGAPGGARGVGDMPFKPNGSIERWGAMRESVEEQFRLNPSTLMMLGLFGVLAPMAIYKGTVAEYHKADALAGRPEKKFM